MKLFPAFHDGLSHRGAKTASFVAQERK
jgi:hypothetical protein